MIATDIWHARNRYSQALEARTREVDRLAKLQRSTDPTDADQVQAQGERVLRAHRRINRAAAELAVWEARRAVTTVEEIEASKKSK